MSSGVILVNKPRGLTSNKVVNIIKYHVGAKKTGHLGTLDKLGEGLLIVTVNNATKIFDEFLKKDKVYVSTFRFGEETPSYDLETEVSKREDVTVTKKQVASVIPSFIGEFDQLPPKHSAKNINGVRAYHLVQKNADFEVKPKRIKIFNIELLEDLGNNTFRFMIHCSSGTYIRSLCRDMAKALGTCGVMYDITRVKSGDFRLEDACSLQDIENGKAKLIPLENLFDLPKLVLDEEMTAKVLQGIKPERTEEDGEYKIYCNDNFFGIGYIKNGELRMRIKD